jgi:hypothetical protein
MVNARREKMYTVAKGAADLMNSIFISGIETILR